MCLAGIALVVVGVLCIIYQLSDRITLAADFMSACRHLARILMLSICN